MDFSADTLMNYISLYSLKVLGAIAIFLIGKWAVRLATNLAKKLMVKGDVDTTLVSFVGNIAYALGMTFVVIASLGQLGVETTSLAAILAAAGLAIGLALQGSLSNLAAGVMIVLFRPFKVGDFIEANGVSGSVDDLNIFTTTLKTGDNKSIIIPNAAVTSGNITNFSARDTRRIDMVFGVGYGDDLKKVKKLLEKAIKADKRILAEPATLVAVSELADSSVNFVVRPWVKSGDYWAVKFDLLEKVKIDMDKAGISIPYPQQDIHLHADAAITKKIAA